MRQRLHHILLVTVAASAGSSASADLSVVDEFGGFVFDVAVYGGDEQDDAYVYLGRPIATVSVPGATVTGQGELNYGDFTVHEFGVRHLAASGFLDVSGTVSESDAGIFAGGIDPHMWVRTVFETTQEYRFDLSALVTSSDGFYRDFVGLVTEHYSQGSWSGDQGTSGVLAPGQYIMLFESAFDFGGNTIGTYHERLDWEFELTITPLTIAIPEPPSQLMWTIAALGGGVTLAILRLKRRASH